MAGVTTNLRQQPRGGEPQWKLPGLRTLGAIVFVMAVLVYSLLFLSLSGSIFPSDDLAQAAIRPASITTTTTTVGGGGGGNSGEPRRAATITGEAVTSDKPQRRDAEEDKTTPIIHKKKGGKVAVIDDSGTVHKESDSGPAAILAEKSNPHHDAQEKDATETTDTSREMGQDTQGEEDEANPSTDTEKANNFVWKYPMDEDLAALQTCFPSNSKEWLRGPRHGNTRIQDPLMDNAFVANMILFGHRDHDDTTTSVSSSAAHDNAYTSETVLKQSMCHTQSRFLNATDENTDNRSMELWIVRLTYMAMHRIQHQFAAPEAQERTKPQQQTTTAASDCKKLAEEYQIGQYDYECPHGKFLIVPIENLGLGAVMRTTVLSGLLAAMATNRTVLFINNAPVGPKPILQPWYHASCDRMDVQCFFHPPTPCVLTHEQLEQAPVMNEFRNVSKLFKSPTKMMEEKFFDQLQTIVLPLKTVTRRIPKNIPNLLRDFTLQFKDNLDNKDPRRTVLQQVAERFVSHVHKDKVEQLVSYGLVLYAMRPHLQSQQKLQKVQQQLVPPSSKKALPEVTLGLPIRASDKCVEESECLKFEQYMRVLVQIWNRNKTTLTQAMKDASVDKLSIVLTTESASVLEEKDAFMADASLIKNTVPFRFEFVVNDFDIQQDSGNPKNNIPEHNLDVELKENNADQVMLSMVSSLQLQLLARYSIGNCCSNFHRILFELLDGGCGAAYQSGPECLQKNQDPEFRICCLWDKSEECEAKNVQGKIEKKWKAVKQKRMQERQRRRQDRLRSMVKGE